jgi:hypothetical protein
MGWCLDQPWMLSLGVGQLARLLRVSNPCSAPAVLTALFQADIPDRAAPAGDAIRILFLLTSELEAKRLPVNMIQPFCVEARSDLQPKLAQRPSRRNTSSSTPPAPAPVATAKPPSAASTRRSSGGDTQGRPTCYAHENAVSAISVKLTPATDTSVATPPLGPRHVAKATVATTQRTHFAHTPAVRVRRTVNHSIAAP